MIVGFLQNAWSPVYAGSEWPRKSWLRALHASRSGKRLCVLVEASDREDWWWDNTARQVAATPKGVCPADKQHITSVLQTMEPEIVVALGKQAGQALPSLWAGPLCVLPHPTYRLVTNSLFEIAGNLLSNRFEDRICLRQERKGRILVGKI